jgi:hypothetical protein
LKKAAAVVNVNKNFETKADGLIHKDDGTKVNPADG